MPLDGLRAQRETARRLLAELKRRPSHAYLFSGPRGIGKALVAAALAHALLCERRMDEDFCCRVERCPVRAAPPPANRRRISPATSSSPRANARARAMASRGRRSCRASASKSHSTRSAQSAAHAATIRRSRSLSVCEMPVSRWSGMRRWPVFGGSTRRIRGATASSCCPLDTHGQSSNVAIHMKARPSPKVAP